MKPEIHRPDAFVYIYLFPALVSHSTDCQPCCSNTKKCPIPNGNHLGCKIKCLCVLFGFNATFFYNISVIKRHCVAATRKLNTHFYSVLDT